MSDYLSPVTRLENERTLTRLRRVMRKHNLKQSEVGYLLDRGRKVVTKWFKHKHRCPDHVPETIDAICSIRTRASIEAEIREKRKQT